MHVCRQVYTSGYVPCTSWRKYMLHVDMVPCSEVRAGRSALHPRANIQSTIPSLSSSPLGHLPVTTRVGGWNVFFFFLPAPSINSNPDIAICVPEIHVGTSVWNGQPIPPFIGRNIPTVKSPPSRSGFHRPTGSSVKDFNLARTSPHFTISQLVLLGDR